MKQTTRAKNLKVAMLYYNCPIDEEQFWSRLREDFDRWKRSKGYEPLTLGTIWIPKAEKLECDFHEPRYEQ